MKIVLAIFSLCASLAAMPAHAGLLDDLLKNPIVQNLMNRTDLPNMVNTCKTTAYREANKAQCANAENALLVTKLPNEMRVVMSSPSAAQSLRDLCGVAQGSPAGNSFLCAELRKAEIAIGINSSITAPPAQNMGRDNDRG